MPPNKLLRISASFLPKPASTQPSLLLIIGGAAAQRAYHSGAHLPLSATGARPRVRPARPAPLSPAAARRTIFIQTESTPNADALKFLPNHPVIPGGGPPFVEYLSARATISPPYPSPLAAQLMAVDGVTAVFYGADFITVTKDAEANWAHIRPEVFTLITEAVTSGAPILAAATTPSAAAEAGKEGEQASGAEDSLSYSEEDGEVVGMIKELLETRIRPAIQEDGGDIEYRGFENGMVLLKLRGACRTCDSSTVTLKSGIEGMLMHYIEEVKGVHQVMDQEEEISVQEFAKFEEKLKLQRGHAEAPPTTVGKGTLDTAQA